MVRRETGVAVLLIGVLVASIRVGALANWDAETLRVLARYRGSGELAIAVLSAVGVAYLGLAMILLLHLWMRSPRWVLPAAGWTVSAALATVVISRAAMAGAAIGVASLFVGWLRGRTAPWKIPIAAAGVVVCIASAAAGSGPWPSERVVETPGDSYEIGRLLQHEGDRVVLLVDNTVRIFEPGEQYGVLRCTQARWWARPTIDLRAWTQDEGCRTNYNLPFSID
ncbi:MAG: hypothetical protein M3Z03_00340 [Actinomycetota bacterium]|nr:hypothetical protein [Actinomycetota bacterium]